MTIGNLASQDMAINTVTYSSLNEDYYWGPEAMGEVWATILWDVSRALIRTHGLSDTLFPSSLSDAKFYKNTLGRLTPRHGNTLMLQLVVNSMKLLPCLPTFFDARDAMIAADRTLTGDENVCLLWRAFARRGLGPGASARSRTPWGGGKRRDDFTLPENCRA